MFIKDKGVSYLRNIEFNFRNQISIHIVHYKLQVIQFHYQLIKSVAMKTDEKNLKKEQKFVND